jgi:predicted  nucleic acid-binding Zn-ribbon protein
MAAENNRARDLAKLRIIINKRKEEFEIELAKLNGKMMDLLTSIANMQEQIKDVEQGLKAYEQQFKKEIMSGSFDAKLLHKGNQKIKKMNNKILELTKNLYDLEDRKVNLQADIEKMQKNVRDSIVQLKKYDELENRLELVL